MSPIGFIQSELDLKLLVLYIMAHTAQPITFLQLLELALCDAGVDYFSLTQAVDHMVETGQLHKEEDTFSITEKGRRNSEICESSLPYSVRMHCDENLLQVNDALRQQAQIQTTTTAHEDGTHTLTLEFNDGDRPLLALSLLVPDQEKGATMADCFRRDPAALYHTIIGLLTSPAQAKGGSPHETI